MRTLALCVAGVGGNRNLGRCPLGRVALDQTYQNLAEPLPVEDVEGEVAHGILRAESARDQAK